MRKASKLLLKQGTQAVPCPRPHPRCKQTTELDWKLSFVLVQQTGHLTRILALDAPAQNRLFYKIQRKGNVVWNHSKGVRQVTEL
jgi:hypothetical protein